MTKRNLAKRLRLTVWVGALSSVFSLASCGSSGESSEVVGSGGSVYLSDASFDALPEVGGAAGSGVDAAEEPEPKLGPPYPIVLCHGFFGFEEFAGLNFATYFYQVKETLAADGEQLVYTPAVDPFNDSTARGAQLSERVREILDSTGYEKVNLIGHSQGGLDARVVAHDHPDWVASVTTFATPHFGTPLADVVLKLISDPNAQQLIDALVKIIGAPIYDQLGNTTSLFKPLTLFSKSGIAAFNAKYTDRPGVSYYSVAGRSDWHLGGAPCQVSGAPDFTSDFKSVTDPIDPLFSLIEEFLDGGITAPYPNDGLVRVTDAKWGTFLGCVPADHLDQVGHLFGDNPGLGNSWRHKPFYSKLVAHLRAQGF